MTDEEIIKAVIVRNLAPRVIQRASRDDRDDLVDTLAEGARTIDLVEALKIQLCRKREQASLTELITAMKSFTSSLLSE